MSATHTVNFEAITEILLPSLLQGDRATVRSLVSRTLGSGVSAEDFIECVAWPIHESLHKLHRGDQIERLSFNYATRLLRTVVDQVQLSYERADRNGKTVALFCGQGENEDLGGQMAADLLDAAGYDVFFAGGGVAHDEILEETHRRSPDFLVLFASSASDAPGIRALIDQVREINAHPNLEVAVGGGVFNRAEGLAEAIGATRVARTPQDLVQVLAAPAAKAQATGSRKGTARLRAVA
jgi:MerR family transcriptional regulator, light-induced transcriptional regulator